MLCSRLKIRAHTTAICQPRNRGTTEKYIMHFKSYLMFTASLYWPRILHWLKEPGRGKKLKSMFYTTGIFDSKRLYKSYRGGKRVTSLESPHPCFTACWSYVFSVSVPNLAPYPTQYECLLHGTHKQTAYKKFYHKNEDIYSRSTNLMVPAIFESHYHEAERTQTEVSCSEHMKASVLQIAS